jgi:hypothetical protein
MPSGPRIEQILPLIPLVSAIAIDGIYLGKGIVLMAVDRVRRSAQAELTAECNLLCVTERLIPEEQHFPP